MRAGDLLKPLGVFVAVVAVVLAGTAVAAVVAGPGGSDAPADGRDVEGQAPAHFQPDRVGVDADPEAGEIRVEDDGEPRRVLVDTQHANQFATSDLDPLVEALTRAGHTVDVGVSGGSEGGGGGGFGQSGYANATLQRYDALLVVAPTEPFAPREVDALERYAEGDGRILVLGEPTQFESGGVASSGSSVRASADDLAAAFGLRIGAESLYNLADDANDNNYESVYATPSGGGTLTEGVDRLQFDAAGYVHTTGDADARTVARAVEGTRTLDRGRTGEYPVVARNGTFVLVADASFVERSELYDADNERFVGNLLSFLVSGDKPDDVPPTPASDGEGEGEGAGGDDGF